jgi:hypothetical protein
VLATKNDSPKKKRMRCEISKIRNLKRIENENIFHPVLSHTLASERYSSHSSLACQGMSRLCPVEVCTATRHETSLLVFWSRFALAWRARFRFVFIFLLLPLAYPLIKNGKLDATGARWIDIVPCASPSLSLYLCHDRRAGVKFVLSIFVSYFACLVVLFDCLAE